MAGMVGSLMAAGVDSNCEDRIEVRSGLGVGQSTSWTKFGGPLDFSWLLVSPGQTYSKGRTIVSCL